MSKVNSTTIRTPRSESKVFRANQIFSETMGMARAIVVARMRRELDLTEAAASTYYQNCRVKAGLAQPRASKSKQAMAAA